MKWTQGVEMVAWATAIAVVMLWLLWQATA